MNSDGHPEARSVMRNGAARAQPRRTWISDSLSPKPAANIDHDQSFSVDARGSSVHSTAASELARPLMAITHADPAPGQPRPVHTRWSALAS